MHCLSGKKKTRSTFEFDNFKFKNINVNDNLVVDGTETLY